MISIEDLKFDEKGLIPAVVLDAKSRKVLTLAYMNRESLRISMEKGLTCFWSRSRQELWLKGETSGNYQHIVSITADCDRDALTVLVEKASGIVDLAGLKDKKVGVSTGSTSAKALATAMAEAGVIDAFDADAFEIATFNAGVSFKEFDDYPAISLALDAGDVDAFCVDKSILANYKTADRSFIDASFSPQDYGVATKKGSELSAKVEALIVEWLADGTIDGLIANWGL